MDYVICSVVKEEFKTAIDWAAKEGWNPGLYDIDSFYAADPTGFYLGFIDREPISSVSAVKYDDSFGFIGLYIVKPEYRGKGYGIKIWNEALKHLPTQNIGLDGVVTAQTSYKKSGFKLAYRNIRYEGTGIAERINNSNIFTLKNIPFWQLKTYDDQVFPSSRPAFLQSWINQPESLAIGYLQDRNLLGYGVIRKCQTGFKIGPLYADNETVADNLFQYLRTHAGAATSIFLDVPEINIMAMSLVKRFNLKPMFETARMYTKNPPNVPLNKIFGVATFELG